MQELVMNQGMIASAVVLAVTFIGIFTEQIHGMERSKVSSAGAVAMVIVGQLYGFYEPMAAVEAVDWNVIFLLAAMMTVVSIMIPTGGFGWMAYKLAVFSKGRLYLMLVLLGTAVTVLSLLLDNVTTVVIFGPLIVLVAQAQKVNPIPYLLAAALLSDTGGVGTLVGDPPNLMIGSAADISFNTFAIRMGPPVFVCWLLVLVMLRFLFHKQLSEKPAPMDMEEVKIKDPQLWRAAIVVLVLMTILFILHNTLHWEPWFVAVLGMTILFFASKRLLMDEAVEHVETPLLIFFIGLFVVIGGVEHSQFLTYIGQFIQPFAESNLLGATIALMWVGAVLSAAIDNIPFTAAMIPIILGMETQGINVAPMWWGLAMGVGLGGNGTHIGSTANVFIVTVSERLARQENDPSLAITPGLWFKKGAPVMFGTLVVATILFTVFFDWFTIPVN
ncbi:MAG: SLC13 family permease [Gammaproteobacteria bacterium]|nr:SLC13 family permease [Gammaproteobacteria bacterium]MDE0248319.1 SLC13 family permease [Gammaproteobacteria bacterium]MDE0395201.1 SLC13 family permease [Gammaproteobacteria bacterium]